MVEDNDSIINHSYTDYEILVRWYINNWDAAQKQQLSSLSEWEANYWYIVLFTCT